MAKLVDTKSLSAISTRLLLQKWHTEKLLLGLKGKRGRHATKRKDLEGYLRGVSEAYDEFERLRAETLHGDGANEIEPRPDDAAVPGVRGEFRKTG